MKADPGYEQLFSNDTTELGVLSENKLQVSENVIKSIKVLVVESDPLSSLYIKAGLYRACISFIIVPGEKEAIAELRKQPFDIVIISINNPKNSSHDLFKKLKGQVLQNTYLIAITCLITLKHINKDQQEFFDHILTQPYSIKDLCKLIVELMTTKPELKVSERKSSFNLEQLQKISNNNEEFITKMLDKFIITAMECSDAITNGLNNEDTEKIKKAAHKAIPSYAIMGLNDLVGYLEHLEANSFSNPEDNIQNIVLRFIEENRQTINDIKDYQSQLRK